MKKEGQAVSMCGGGVGLATGGDGPSFRFTVAPEDAAEPKSFKAYIHLAAFRSHAPLNLT